MRLFIAILVEPFKEYLLSLQNFPEKFTYPKEFHLTLKFLGEVQDTAIITSALAKVKSPFFTLTLNTLGYFGITEIRTLWVGLKETAEITTLQQRIENILSFPKESNFHPHITIARVKNAPIIEIQKRISSIQMEQRSIDIREFCLIKSTLTPIGPHYEIIERFSLGNL